MATQEGLCDCDQIFKGVNYYLTGRIPHKIHMLLRDGGGQQMFYFSDYVTHCIVGENAAESDITEANELYEIPAVRMEWIVLCSKFKKLLPTKGFLAGHTQIFSGVIACVSKLKKSDAKRVWVMITFNGGRVESFLQPLSTHLIVSRPEGIKYEQAIKPGSAVNVVTLDWVTDSIREGMCCEEALYHPRLLLLRNPHGDDVASPTASTTASVMSSGATLSTAEILGFMDNAIENSVPPPVSKSKALILEQLKQRMPWNQPAFTQPKTVAVSSAGTSPPFQQVLLPQQVGLPNNSNAGSGSTTTTSAWIPVQGENTAADCSHVSTSAKKEIALLTEMIKKYDMLIAHEKKLLKLQQKNNAFVVGAEVTAKSGIDSHHPFEEVESDESMLRRLEKCELLHKMKFADEQIEKISSNVYRYRATGFSGPVKFKICFEVEEPRDDDEVEYYGDVKTIDINFLEPFHKEELSIWLPKCLQNNDLQTILRNIPVYGKLYAAREKIIEVLENSYSRFFTVYVQTEVGGVLITAHNEHKETYFEVEWKIITYPHHQSLCNSLFFSVYEFFSTPDLLGKCEDAFKSLAEHSAPTFESLMANWETIVKVVSGASS